VVIEVGVEVGSGVGVGVSVGTGIGVGLEAAATASAVSAAEVAARSSGERPQPAIIPLTIRTGMTANIRIVFTLIAPLVMMRRFIKTNLS
jgi:hypothetical protein